MELSAAILGCSLALASAGIQLYNLAASVTICCCSAGEGRIEYLINPTNYLGKTLIGSLVLSVSSSTGEEVELTQVYSQGRLPAEHLVEMMDIGSEICTSLYIPLQRQFLKEYWTSNDSTRNYN